MDKPVIQNSTTRTIYQTTMFSGHHWSLRMQRGHALTLLDSQGGVNVGMLLYNPQLLQEKYNAPDTMKCQHTFQLGQGNCLYSDMGRIFCSITEDTFGGHDTVCGNSDAQMVSQRWASRSYQQQRNNWSQNGYDSFLTELAKYGLNSRQLAANVNWFSHVAVDDNGNMKLRNRPAQPSRVTLRFEMDTLVIMHTCPHPLDLRDNYPNARLDINIASIPELQSDDICLNHCEENRRGFQNNALYHMEPAYDQA